MNILQSMPNFGDEEANACYEYMKSGGFVTEYKKTTELEQKLCEYLNINHCIMTTSGTSALIVSLLSLGIKTGDEVIVPNYTMIATVNSVKMVGATPVLIDVDKKTYTISLNEIKKHVTSNTKAIIHVSLNNRCKNLDKISEFCFENNIYLIEDSAQSLGCKYKNKYFGTYGTLGCFSLSSPKIISTGQGGFIVTNDDVLNQKIRQIKNFGRETSGNDIYSCFGINVKFTDLQAVIGIEQLKKLDSRVTRLREIYKIYYEQLCNHYEIIPPCSNTWIPWFVDIYTDNRDDIMSYLKKNGIQTRKTYPCVNTTSTYLSSKKFKNSSYVSLKGIFLPTHSLLSNKDILYICSILKKYSET